MAKKPKPPKAPKPKKSLGQHFKNSARKATASSLRKSFGVLGDVVAKRYLGSSSKKKVKVESDTANKSIKKKKISKTEAAHDAIESSGKQVAAAIEVVATNVTRSFSRVSRQVDTMGKEVSESIEELNRILDTVLYKKPTPETAPDASKGAERVKNTNSDGGGGLPFLAIGKIAGLFGVAYALDQVFPDGEKSLNEYLKKYTPKLASKDENVGGVNRWIFNHGAGAINRWMHGKDATQEPSTGKEIIGGGDTIIQKIKYKTEKIKFDATGKIEFKSKSSGSGGGTGSSTPKPMGSLNRILGAIGIGGGAGSVNSMADAATGRAGGGAGGGGGGGGGGPISSPPVGGGKGGGKALKGEPLTNKEGAFQPGFGGKVGQGLGAARPGHLHQGVDVMMPHGSDITASMDGVVIKSERQGGALNSQYGGTSGGIVTVKYANGMTAKYLHTSDPYSKDGPIVHEKQHVKAGDVIGKSGTAAGVPHVHYELYDKNGQRMDPSEYHGWKQGGIVESPADRKAKESKNEFKPDQELIQKGGPVADGGWGAMEKEVDDKTASTATKFGGGAASFSRQDNDDWSGNPDRAMPQNWSGSGKDWGWMKPMDNFDTHTGEKRWEDRQNEASPTHDDEYSQATWEGEAWERLKEGHHAQITAPSEPTPLGYALGGRDLLEMEKKPVSESAAFWQSEEKGRWDAMKPPDETPKKDRHSDLGSNNDKQAYMQDTQKENSSLDHRPRQDAVQQQNFGSYLGVNSGSEDTA